MKESVIVAAVHRVERQEGLMLMRDHVSKLSIKFRNNTTSEMGYEADNEVERETGFEPATSTLARLRSTN